MHTAIGVLAREERSDLELPQQADELDDAIIDLDQLAPGRLNPFAFVDHSHAEVPGSRWVMWSHPWGS
jgi:hypothetical protein